MVVPHKLPCHYETTFEVVVGTLGAWVDGNVESSRVVQSLFSILCHMQIWENLIKLWELNDQLLDLLFVLSKFSSNMFDLC
jgi:hypothetical protein